MNPSHSAPIAGLRLIIALADLSEVDFPKKYQWSYRNKTVYDEYNKWKRYSKY